MKVNEITFVSVEPLKMNFHPWVVNYPVGVTSLMTPFNGLCRIHQGQITSNQVLLPVVDQLRKSTLTKVAQIRVSVSSLSVLPQNLFTLYVPKNEKYVIY